ncbi:hypothetical protein HBA42_21205, partial [Providencia rettgeri]|nr:hypothetical protein [Providencia rettgeri]
QLAIGVIGTHGAYPFMVVLGLLLLAGVLRRNRRNFRRKELMYLYAWF